MFSNLLFTYEHAQVYKLINISILSLAMCCSPKHHCISIKSESQPRFSNLFSMANPSPSTDLAPLDLRIIIIKSQLIKVSTVQALQAARYVLLEPTAQEVTSKSHLVAYDATVPSPVTARSFHCILFKCISAICAFMAIANY